ncbi:hypothetical protein [Sharpea azabuensis]
MAIVTNASYSGSKSTQTLSGNIELNEGTGELLIRNGAKILTRINSKGFTYYDTDGKARIRLGLDTNEGAVGFWISKEGYDVLEVLG